MAIFRQLPPRTEHDRVMIFSFYPCIVVRVHLLGVAQLTSAGTASITSCPAVGSTTTKPFFWERKPIPQAFPAHLRCR